MQKQGASILLVHIVWNMWKSYANTFVLCTKVYRVVQVTLPKFKSWFWVKKTVVIVGIMTLTIWKKEKRVESMRKRKNCSYFLKFHLWEVSHVLFKEITKLGYVKKFGSEELHLWYSLCESRVHQNGVVSGQFFYKNIINQSEIKIIFAIYNNVSMLIIGLMNFKDFKLVCTNETIKLLLLQKRRIIFKPFIKCLKLSIVKIQVKRSTD